MFDVEHTFSSLENKSKVHFIVCCRLGLVNTIKANYF